MSFYMFEGRRPKVGKTSFVHDKASVIGDVSIGEGCFIGAGAVLRGDWGRIVLGDGSNVQENAVVHAGPGATTHLSANTHIGHAAILHGCFLEEHVLVGMGAVINDGARIGSDSLIAAGAVVPPGLEIPPRSLAIGVPAQVVREVSDTQLQYTWAGTRLYQTLPERYASSLEEVPLEQCHEQL